MKKATTAVLLALGVASAHNETSEELADAFGNIFIKNMGIVVPSDPKDYMQDFKDLEAKKEAGTLHSDAFKTMEQIANEHGFKCEKTQVVTDDGYILGIYRIPGKLSGSAKPGPPVLLQHGLEADMMQWVYNEPDVAPALVLARAGYDVWFGNNRGNMVWIISMISRPARIARSASPSCACG